MLLLLRWWRGKRLEEMYQTTNPSLRHSLRFLPLRMSPSCPYTEAVICVTTVLQQVYNSVTTVLQECYKSVTTVEQEIPPPTSGPPVKSATVLQECYNSVTTVLQQCYKSVRRVLEECYKVVHECYKGFTRVFQECSKSVPRVLPECYKRLTRVLQNVHEWCGNRTSKRTSWECNNSVTRVLWQRYKSVMVDVPLNGQSKSALFCKD
jgi:hypothetical protein